MDVGDVVVLRAGGPEMVVASIRKAVLGRQLISCVWFARTKKVQASFDAKILKRMSLESHDKS
jgi:uncharacterized protein YodC (DUF2158 family)